MFRFMGTVINSFDGECRDPDTVQSVRSKVVGELNLTNNFPDTLTDTYSNG